MCQCELTRLVTEASATTQGDLTPGTATASPLSLIELTSQTLGATYFDFHPQADNNRGYAITRFKQQINGINK